MLSVGSTDISTQLLAQDSTLNPADRVLVLSAGDPALTLAVGRQVASVSVYDSSYSALLRVYQQINARLKDANITISDEVFPPADSGFDAALMAVPKGRDYARAQLWSALRALRPGGRLYIAGANDSGAKSVLADAQVLFGSAVTLNYKRHHRIGSATRPETIPAYPADWGDDPTLMRWLTLDTPHGTVNVATMPSIFSWQHLDEGTTFLLDNLNFEPGQDVLDVGCGYGVIGLLAAQAARQVTMVDDNLLAVRCAYESVQASGLSNIEVLPSDVYSDLKDRQFDLIVSNPPFHKDFDVNTNVAHRLMREAKDRLRSGGRLVIVANAFLNYEKVMAANLPKVRVIARNNRFIVLEGKR